MTAETILILLYGLGALLCIVVGFAALKYGKDLYVSGIGLQQDGSSVDVSGAKIQLKTVGSVVMLTSIAWGVLAWQIFPDYHSDEAGNVKVGNDKNLDEMASSFYKSTQFEELSEAYISGLAEDSSGTVDTWQKLAEHDVLEAQLMMGYAYKNGLGIDQNQDSSLAVIERIDLKTDSLMISPEQVFDSIPTLAK